MTAERAVVVPPRQSRSRLPAIISATGMTAGLTAGLAVVSAISVVGATSASATPAPVSLSVGHSVAAGAPGSASPVAKPQPVRAVRVLRFPSASSAAVGWLPPAAATPRPTSYLVRASAPNSTTRFGPWLRSSVSSRLVQGLAPGAVHRVQVVAKSPAGHSVAATVAFRQPSSPSPDRRPAPIPTPTPVVRSVLDFGAKGDGATDDSAAIQSALASMRGGETLVFPAGRTFAHSRSLSVVVSGTRLTGGGVLLATDEQNSKLLVRRVNNTTIDNLTIQVDAATRRWSEYEKMGIVLLETTGSKISDVTIDGTGSAGLYVGRSGNFQLNRIAVRNAKADSIHITEGSHDGVVNDAVVANSGDDGISIVSYRDGNPPVTNVTINNPRLIGQVWGRAFAVVGGTNITWRNIHAEGSSSASVYIAAEREWNTLNSHNILVDGGSIVAANRNASVDHGAVMIYNSAGGVNSNITVRNLNITGTRAGAARQVA
ncbi:MAG: hypothetical protein QG671_3407, partial [Actinomycetota bacterium]|nr:hypothetical protein [Actinomycetota bacterium]